MSVPASCERQEMTDADKESKSRDRKIAENAVHVAGDVDGGEPIWLTKNPARVAVRLGKRAKVAIIS